MKNQNSDDSYHAFLESLKGKVVTIYRGGPESKTGQLLDVQSDYVTLYAQNNNNNNNNNNNQKNNNTQNNNQQNNQNDNNQNTVVYYQAKHVKSISEDTMTNSTQTTDSMPQEVPFLVADTFASLIANLQDETVQINQGGPESKYGTLLGVNGDFMVLYTEDDGVVYFNLDHVKSVSEYQDNNSEDEDDQNNDQQSEIVYPEILEASNFHNVFSHMAHKWVSINRGGPEAMEGVLVENSGGHYTLVSNQEVLRIHPYHIRSISAGAKGSYSQNNQNNNNQDNQNDNSNDNTNNNDTENKANDNKSESKEKDSKSSHGSERTNRERVVKTIDYVWKGR
jgi:spore coat protein B